MAARGREGAAVDDRARGLRAARPAAAAGRVADPPGAVGQSGQQLKFELQRHASSTRRTARCCASRARASRPRTSTRSREAAEGSKVTWVIDGDTTSFKARLIAPMVQAKLQEKLDHDLARLRARSGRRTEALMRRALLIAALLRPARACARARRRADRPRGRGLQSDNVYVDPDADPTLTDAQADALRDRIAERARGPDVRGRRAARRSRARPAATRRRRAARDRATRCGERGHLRDRRRAQHPRAG